MLDLARIGMIVGIGWLAYRVVQRRSVRVPPLRFAIPIVLVVLVDLASLLMFRWPGGVKHVGAILAYVGFGFFAYQVVGEPRRRRIVLIALFVSGVIEALVLLAQQLGDFYLWLTPQLLWYGRRNGTFVDPNIAVRFLLISIAVGLGLLGARLGRRRWVERRPAGPPASAPWDARLPLIGGLAVLALGAVLTLSRTGWALLFLVAIAWPIVARRRVPAILGTGALVLGFGVGLLLAPNALIRASDAPIVDESSGGSQGGASGPSVDRTTTTLDPVLRILPLDEVRHYLARGGAAMFEDHPLFGVGLGGFQPELLGPYREFIPVADRSAPISLQHMDVLRIAAEEGVLGLAAWALLLASLAVAARMAVVGPGRGASSGGEAGHDRFVPLAAAGGILIILAGSQTEGRFYLDPYLWLLVAVLIGAAVAPDLLPAEVGPDGTADA